MRYTTSTTYTPLAQSVGETHSSTRLLCSRYIKVQAKSDCIASQQVTTTIALLTLFVEHILSLEVTALNLGRHELRRCWLCEAVCPEDIIILVGAELALRQTEVDDSRHLKQIVEPALRRN